MPHRLLWRLAGGVVAVLAALPMFGPPPAWGQGDSVEYGVKATYLYKFLPFVSWSGGKQPGSYLLCVVGDDPFGLMLDRAVSGQTIEGRPIEVQRMALLRRDSGCHLVYAAGSAAQPVAAILAELRGRPVLSVTDGARDSASRGMVNFVIAGNRVRFEIDDAIVAEGGLSISSKLLGLATFVRPRGGG